jgi:antigen flippase
MGGAAGINMLLGMVRTKFAAILIGPLGIGMLANFIVIQTLVSTIAGFGIQPLIATIKLPSLKTGTTYRMY